MEANRLDVLAHTDSLTGLANRRAWEEQLPDLLGQAGAEPFTVCVLDLDHFKAYNDAYGHAAGDSLLAETAEVWRQAIRPGDLLVRIGGEEFALALPNCDIVTARVILERLRSIVPDGQTCSAGLTHAKPREHGDALLARADAALYKAKRTGRNKTAIAA